MEKTFTLTITDQQYGEWQGYLKGKNDAGQYFASVLELIKLINCEVEEDAG